MAKPMKMAKSKKGKLHRKLTAKLLPSVRPLRKGNSGQKYCPN